MKAWIVYPVHDTWQALTFAETRSKARWMTARHYGCGNYDEAVCFRARRDYGWTHGASGWLCLDCTNEGYTW